MMIATLSLLLAVASAPASPTVLYCVGDAWMKVGEPTQHSTVLTLDIERSVATVNTFSGTATGALQKTEHHYKGTLQSSGGVTYWFNVDRFSGEFWLSIPAENRSEFLGGCKPTTQKF